MKVSAILKGKPDQLDRFPVVIRINEGEKRTFKVTSYRGTKDKDGKMILEPWVADKIRNMIVRTEMELLEGTRKYADAEFFTYVDKCLKEWATVRAYNTMRNYKAETEKLKGFRSTFKLSQVTPEFLRAYSHHLYTKEGNISTTVWTSFKFLRMIMLKARRERIIEENPFDIFRIEAYKDPEIQYLTKEEVNKIEAFLPEAGPLTLCATWFVIGCYTGLRYSDMNAFSKEKKIKSGRIVLRTVKTKDIVSMPLSDRLRRLFESINYQPMFISNQKFNDALKDVAKKLKLQPINVHLSRHSFGVMCAEAGISQEVTGRLLGHKSLKSTAIYYKITNPRIDAEIGKIG